MPEKSYISMERHEKLSAATKDQLVEVTKRVDRLDTKLKSLHEVLSVTQAKNNELYAENLVLKKHIQKFPNACPDCGQSPLVPENVS